MTLIPAKPPTEAVSLTKEMPPEKNKGSVYLERYVFDFHHEAYAKGQKTRTTACVVYPKWAFDAYRRQLEKVRTLVKDNPGLVLAPREVSVEKPPAIVTVYHIFDLEKPEKRRVVRKIRSPRTFDSKGQVLPRKVVGYRIETKSVRKPFRRKTGISKAFTKAIAEIQAFEAKHGIPEKPASTQQITHSAESATAIEKSHDKIEKLPEVKSESKRSPSEMLQAIAKVSEQKPEKILEIIPGDSCELITNELLVAGWPTDVSRSATLEAITCFHDRIEVKSPGRAGSWSVSRDLLRRVPPSPKPRYEERSLEVRDRVKIISGRPLPTSWPSSILRDEILEITAFHLCYAKVRATSRELPPWEVPLLDLQRIEGPCFAAGDFVALRPEFRNGKGTCHNWPMSVPYDAALRVTSATAYSTVLDISQWNRSAGAAYVPPRYLERIGSEIVAKGPTPTFASTEKPLEYGDWVRLINPNVPPSHGWPSDIDRSSNMRVTSTSSSGSYIEVQILPHAKPSMPWKVIRSELMRIPGGNPFNPTPPVTPATSSPASVKAI